MPLTPIRRAKHPVLHPDGRIEPCGRIWRLPRPDSAGFPGEFVIDRPGGWRSLLALGRLLGAAL